MSCFVCEKHQLVDAAEGGVLFEDDVIYVGHVHTRNGPTVYRGHLVVEPRRHVAGNSETSMLPRPPRSDRFAAEWLGYSRSDKARSTSTCTSRAMAWLISTCTWCHVTEEHLASTGAPQ